MSSGRNPETEKVQKGSTDPGSLSDRIRLRGTEERGRQEDNDDTDESRLEEFLRG